MQKYHLCCLLRHFINLLIINVLLLSQYDLYGKNYYVSNNGNDNNTGLSIDQAWNSIAKINNSFALFNPGDSILLRKGDKFFGTINISKSGLSNQEIVIGSFGKGNNPIITGFIKLEGQWTKYSDHIYRRSVSSESSIEYLLINGIAYLKGRYPNSRKYLITGAGDKTYFEDKNHLNQSDNYWNGAEVIVRFNRWAQQKLIVSDFVQSNSRIYFSSNSNFNVSVGYGYFIQNSIHCLLDHGDWFWDGSFIYVYSDTDPNNIKVEASILNTGIEFSNDKYVKVERINLTGFNLNAVSIINSSSISFNLCSINKAIKGINLYGSSKFVIQDNELKDIYHNAITAESCSFGTIQGNSIDSIGLNGTYSLMGLNGIVFSISNNIRILKNRISNTGYNGILAYRLDNSVIEKNKISDYCKLVDDGGGIYVAECFMGDTIRNNMVIGGDGSICLEDVPSSLYQPAGIYLDTWNTNVYVANNLSVKNLFGYMNNGPSNCTWINNWSTKSIGSKDYPTWGCFDFYVSEALGHSVSGNKIINNKFVSNYNSSNGIRQIPLSMNNIDSDNIFDYNYYLLPTGNLAGYTSQLVEQNGSSKTLSQWIAGDGGNNEKGDVLRWESKFIETSHEEFICFDYNFSDVQRNFKFEKGYSYFNILGEKVNSFNLNAYEGAVLLRIDNKDLGIIEDIPVSAITIICDKNPIKVGETLQLTTSIMPENATNQSISWSVINETGQAKISENGLLTALHTGTVIVKATANDGSDVYGTLQILFEEAPIPSGIFIRSTTGDTSINIPGGTLQLNSFLISNGSRLNEVDWSVKNETGQASIDNSGLVKAISDGNVRVFAVTQDSIYSDYQDLVILNQGSKDMITYIDPEINNSLQLGTIEYPYHSWSMIKWQEGGIYLQKRGTEANETEINIGANHVKLGSYGSGTVPVIKSNTISYVIKSFEKSDVQIKDISINSSSAASCVYFIGENTDSIDITNCIFENSQNGIRIIGGDQINISCNKLSNCKEGIYITCKSGSVNYNVFEFNEIAVNASGISSNIQIVNNTFFNNSIGLSSSSSSLTLYNNIFNGTIDSRAAINGDPNNLISDYNVYNYNSEKYITYNDVWFNLEDVQNKLLQDKHSLSEDPKFVNVDYGDYSLSKGSPAINSGIILNYSNDFSGNKVPIFGKTDIGAFEFDGNIQENKKNKSELLIYPNPTRGISDLRISVNDELNVDDADYKVTDFEIRVISSLGKLVYRKNINISKVYLMEQIDLSHLVDGIYIVIVQWADKFIQEKLILSK